MEKVLRKLHNLMLNCESMMEFYEYAFLVSYSHPEHKEQIKSIVDGAILAGECSILPIYYFKASEVTGMRQDREGRFYIELT